MTTHIRSSEIRNRTFAGKRMHRATEIHPMYSFRFQQTQLRPVLILSICLVASGLTTLLAGCGTASTASDLAGTQKTIKVSGTVHGGQNPVSQATIQLYTVGTGGLKSASASLIASPPQTGSDGSFNITGAFSCTTATQVYIVSSGGSSGSGPNSSIALAAALGPCTSLNSGTYIVINEVTTIAAAYALAPFASDFTHIGATGSNPTGLVNAFANAALLANTALGSAGGASVPAGVTVPLNEIDTLADIVSACVNTAGASSSACTSLFSATGAADTFGASLAIAKNPAASAVTALYSLSVPTAPFQPTLTAGSAPNDFTVAINTTAAGTLATPYGIALDAAGNAWVTNETGSTVSELSSSGGLLASPAATGLAGAQGVAVDRTGNVWVANTAGNSVVKFTLTGGSVTATNSYTAGGITAPTAIALDSAGNAFIANLNGNSVTGLNSAGVPLSGSPFTGSSNNITVPNAIAVGPAGTVYVTSGSGSIVKLSNAGAFLATMNDGTLQGPVGVAVDGAGRALATGFTTGASVGGALSQFTSGGAAATGSPITSGISSPSGVASDGTSIWVANNASSGSLAQFSYASSSPLSPAAGFGSLTSPIGVAVDSSGCVWTANSGSNTISKFIGLASPVATPLAASVGP
jgi:sugar lactone lactonase YvrE